MGFWKRLFGMEVPEPRVVTLTRFAEGGLTPAIPIPPRGEAGIPGSLNTGGWIRAENNSDLKDFLGRGQPSIETWGVWERLVRTDPACVKGLEMVAAPIRSAEVEVEPASDDEDSEEEKQRATEIADFVRDNLQKWLEPTWQEFVDQCVKTFLTFGFSIHEEVWSTREDDRVPGGTAFYLQKLAQRLPSSLAYNAWQEENGELAFVRQQGIVDNQYKYVDLPAKKMLLVSWNRGGNNYPGYSAFRSIYRVAETRAEILRILGIGVQREMLGVPTAEPSETADLDQGELDKLQKTLENLTAHENAALVSLPGVALKWWFSPVANKGHAMELYEKLGLVILQVLFSEQSHLGTSGTGSRAVGDIHVDAKSQFIEGVKANFEAALNGVGSRPYTGPVKKLVDSNFGPQDEYPRVRLVLKRPNVQPQDKATAIGTLLGAQALTWMPDDENVIRDELGLPPIDPEDREAELQKRQQQKADAAQQQLELAKAQGGPKPPSAGAAKPKPDAAPQKLTDAVQTFAPRRPLTANEGHLALGEMDDFHTAARREFETHAKEIAKRMVRDAKPAIAKSMADPAKLANLPLNTGTLAKTAEVFAERARNFGYAQAEKERKRQPAGLVQKRERGESGVPAMGRVALREFARMFRFEEEEDAAAPDAPKAEKLIKAQTTLVTNRIKARLKQQIQDEAIDQARTGGNEDDVVDAVLDDIDGSGTYRTDAGFLTARSFSMGREEFAEEHADEIASVVFSAVLDNNTCEPCNDADGDEFDFDSQEHDDHVPPYSECEGGNNCRCLLIYLYEGGGGFQREDDEGGD